jgi:hypothetical protein
MSKKSKKDSKLKYPTTIHVINLGTNDEPDFITAEDPATILSEYADSTLVGVYELVGSSKARLTQEVEWL